MVKISTAVNRDARPPKSPNAPPSTWPATFEKVDAENPPPPPYLEPVAPREFPHPLYELCERAGQIRCELGGLPREGRQEQVAGQAQDGKRTQDDQGGGQGPGYVSPVQGLHGRRQDYGEEQRRGEQEYHRRDLRQETVGQKQGEGQQHRAQKAAVQKRRAYAPSSTHRLPHCTRAPWRTVGCRLHESSEPYSRSFASDRRLCR